MIPGAEHSGRIRPLVSVVMPTLNSARYVEESLRSVLEQDYREIECLVIDGGSTDGTVDILRAHESHIHWISEPDGGQAQALNKGFGLASGEIFAWLNGDDRYLPGSVSTAVRHMDQHPGAAAVYGDVTWIDGDGRILQHRRSLPFDLKRLLNYYNYIPQMSTFFRRWAWEQSGGLDETLSFAMDYDLWIRMGRAHPMHYLPHTLAQWRVHGNSKTSSSPLVAMPENLRVSRVNGGMRYSPMWVSAWLWRMGGSGLVRWIRTFVERRWRCESQ
jgi:glycosyltransferase involved in cell wall biosynthesis